MTAKSALLLLMSIPALGLTGCAATSEECTKRVVIGTGLGTAGGAAVGAIVGGATGGVSAGRGALWGAGAGAVVGGVAAGLTCSVPSGETTSYAPEPIPPYAQPVQSQREK